MLLPFEVGQCLNDYQTRDDLAPLFDGIHYLLGLDGFLEDQETLEDELGPQLVLDYLLAEGH